ncbi:hypothetical protein [Kitasatospora sp. NPDC088346]|uniref:hypothetical protein n=1 Tax=Kitasatospora sp. NPDC088346 TaxID=3364073 RepID=UPI0037F576D4
MSSQVHHSRYCPTCGTPVKDGPRGGYVCTLCYTVEEPPGAVTDRTEWRHTKRRRLAAARAVWEREGLLTAD